MTVIDWYTDTNLDHERFAGTVEGIASVAYAKTIINAQQTPIQFEPRDVRAAVISKEGQLEEVQGTSLTFCAFDDDASIPIAFAGLDTKSKWVGHFISCRRKNFEIGVGEGYAERIRAEDDKALAGFAYELYHNSLEH